MFIQFKDVGRDNYNGKVKIPDNLTPDEIAERAYRHIAKSNVLLSRSIDTEYNAITNEGSVVAGFRTVGGFSVVND